MNTPPSPQSNDSSYELDLLIEGELSAEAAQALHSRMKSDAALLTQYLKKVRLDSMLRDRDWSAELVSPAKPEVRWRVFTPRRVAWAAAAAVVLSLSLWQWTSHQPQRGAEPAPEVALMSFNPTAVFETSSPNDFNDGRLRFGDGIVMNDGSVSIRLPSGVEAVLKSPSRFAITASNRLSLTSGSGWFRVPPSAKGFTVETPWMEVVDLGTVFIVSVAENEQRVQVQQGHVEVRLREGGVPVQNLVAGQNLLRQATGKIEITSGGALEALAMHEEKPEIVFQESLNHVADQPFSERKPLVGSWVVQEGTPQVRNGRFSAQSTFTHLMGRFSRTIEASENAVLLVSFKSVSPTSLFHSKGFAGISLFDGEGEMFFLGDRSDNSYSWDLQVYGKKFWSPGTPRRSFNLAIQGSEETFTLRYRQQNGRFEVFRGWGVQGVPIVQGKTDPGLRFDGVRVANGRGGDFSFEDLQVSVVKEKDH